MNSQAPKLTATKLTCSGARSHSPLLHRHTQNDELRAKLTAHRHKVDLLGREVALAPPLWPEAGDVHPVVAGLQLHKENGRGKTKGW